MDGSGEITEFRAAQYVRMSTEHQQYSTHNQSDKIREYAEKRGIEIIKTYADDQCVFRLIRIDSGNIGDPLVGRPQGGDCVG